MAQRKTLFSPQQDMHAGCATRLQATLGSLFPGPKHRCKSSSDDATVLPSGWISYWKTSARDSVKVLCSIYIAGEVGDVLVFLIPPSLPLCRSLLPTVVEPCLRVNIH